MNPQPNAVQRARQAEIEEARSCAPIFLPSHRADMGDLIHSAFRRMGASLVDQLSLRGDIDNLLYLHDLIHKAIEKRKGKA